MTTVDKKVLEELEKLGTTDAEKAPDFNGYEVYKPVYREDVAIGLPLIVLKKGDEVRISTPDEAFAFLDANYGDEEDD